MKFSSLALAATIGLANAKLALGQERVWLDTKPDSDAVRNRDRFLRELQAYFSSEVSFGPACPALPAGRNPGLGATFNDGWFQAPMGYNDDSSHFVSNLGFDFAMYGETRQSIWINNNGNLSFQRYSAYTPTGFPVNGFKMVAPFWADVDTRGRSGVVWMKFLGGNSLAVAWDHVDYFSAPNPIPKANTFQVIISDGNNPEMGIGNNVCFCYDEMEWTTGQASGGDDEGFGGSPATVGVNNGDGVNYSAFGRYNDAGVSALNGQSYCFAVGSTGNIAPIPSGFPSSGVLFFGCGESLTDYQVSFLSPENGQTTTITVETAPPNMDIAIQNGNTATATINWVAPSIEQYYYLALTGTDDAGDSTSVEVVLATQGPTCRGGGGGGDPHYKSWVGEYYDFHGICDLLLLDAPSFSDGLGLSIQIRTKPRYQYSFIESAAVKIGDSILEVSSWGQYMLDGISNAEFPFTMSSEKFPVTYEKRNEKSGAFRIGLHNGEEIVVSFLKDMVSVSVRNGTKENFGDSVGLMGDYNHGRKLARDGTTELSDPNAFGQEWQVLPDEPRLFQAPSSVTGNTCLPPNTSKNRRLGEAKVSKEIAEAVCAQYNDVSMKERCVFDVLAMDDLDVAAGAF